MHAWVPSVPTRAVAFPPADTDATQTADGRGELLRKPSHTLWPKDGPVVVADWRCDWVGLGLATMLATGGREVLLASSGYVAGQRIQQYVRDQMTVAARKARVEMRTTVKPFGFAGPAAA